MKYLLALVVMLFCLVEAKAQEPNFNIVGPSATHSSSELQAKYNRFASINAAREFTRRNGYAITFARQITRVEEAAEEAARRGDVFFIVNDDDARFAIGITREIPPPRTDPIATIPHGPLVPTPEAPAPTAQPKLAEPRTATRVVTTTTTTRPPVVSSPPPQVIRYAAPPPTMRMMAPQPRMMAPVRMGGGGGACAT